MTFNEIHISLFPIPAHKAIVLTCLLNISRRNYQKTIDNIQSSLEQESRSKQEMMKARKKLEADINEYEVALEIANRNNQEGQKLVKKLQSQVKVTYIRRIYTWYFYS